MTEDGGGDSPFNLVSLDESAKKAETKRQRFSKFTNELINKGVVELNSPAVFEGKKIIATYRKGDNPNLSGKKVSRSEFNALSKWASGYTQVHVINLLMEDSQNPGKYLPIGRRDYRVARFKDGKVVANGHFESKKENLEMPKDIDPGIADALSVADKAWGPSENGIDVVKEIKSKIKGTIFSYPIRKKGLGGLLTAVGIEILKKSGVEELEVSGVSDEYESIMKRVGIENTWVGDTEKIQLDNIPPDDLVGLTGDFLVN